MKSHELLGDLSDTFEIKGPFEFVVVHFVIKFKLYKEIFCFSRKTLPISSKFISFDNQRPAFRSSHA